jgi:hypothetical protein
MSAAFLMALVDEFGFGKKRLAAAYDYAAELSDMLDNGKVTYQEIERRMEEIAKKGGRENEGKKNPASVGG